VQGDVHLFGGDAERGAEAKSGLAAASNNKPALEGGFARFLRGGWGRVFVRVVGFDDVHCQHQAQAAHVASGGCFVGQVAQAGTQLFASAGSVGDVFALQQIQRGQAARN